MLALGYLRMISSERLRSTYLSFNLYLRAERNFSADCLARLLFIFPATESRLPCHDSRYSRLRFKLYHGERQIELMIIRRLHLV